MASSYAKQSFSFICFAVAALLILPSQSFGQDNGGGTGGGGGGTGTTTVILAKGLRG